MRQNMFQEGLYQVFFKDPPLTRQREQVVSHEELHSARLHRWFGTVVNTRLLVTAVVQALSALVCILTAVIHECVSYSCSASLPVWSSLFYVAAASLTLEVQRKPHKFKIIILVLLNVFCLLFGFSVLLADNLRPKQPKQPPITHQQLIGSYVAKWSSLAFGIQCFLSSLYILFLSWRGLRRYSSAQAQTYNQLAQETETNEGLLEHMEYNL